MRFDLRITQRMLRAAAVACEAVLLCWPALLNRFPLMFPDSVSYLGYSVPIWHKLLGQAVPEAAYETHRSAIFSLWLLSLYWKRLAPIVLVQGVLAAWVLWLLVRSMVPQRPLRVYLAVVTFLAIVTSLPWYVSFIMADIYGPLVYIAVFLLMFVREKLALWEKIALGAIFGLGIAAHSAHFILAIALWMVMTIAWLLRSRVIAGRGLVLVAALILVTTLCQMAVNKRLWGQATVFGRPYAFLMARLLGDGPARLYLQQHCPIDHWLICKYSSNLPATEDDFLWSTDSIWSTSSPADQEELRREQVPLALRTLAAYPTQQIAQTTRNMTRLLFSSGPNEFFNYPQLHDGGLEWLAPGLTHPYLRSRQATSSMPTERIRRIQTPLLVLSAIVDFMLLGWSLRTRHDTLSALLLTILFVVNMNALVSGGLSTFALRLQDRIGWMLTLGALIGGYLWIAAQRHRLAAGTPGVRD